MTSDAVKPIHVLIVDDDDLIRKVLSDYLRGQGVNVSEAHNGAGMRDVLAKVASIDLILLDLVMPGESGLTLAQQVRSQSDVPIIMLSALSDVIDRVTGLELGADDYLCKPFHPREVLARVRAVLRRGHTPFRPVATTPTDMVYDFDGWELQAGTRRLSTSDGIEVPLTTMEFDLLLAFATNPGRVLDRDKLMDLTKGRNWAAFDRSIDQQVGRLRRKIEVDPGHPSLIKTIRGAGYMFAVKVHARPV